MTQIICYDIVVFRNADVAELADALDLGSSSVRSEGSSPFIRILLILISRKAKPALKEGFPPQATGLALRELFKSKL